ncbi:imidazolonepropionase [Agrobacterium tumefaciens]|uniref:Imidazolonepropionase n=6 Tax=Rhizobium/Agrobacterium group TaxID=227290 RepID=A0A2Z2PMG0_RHIRH|nr:imidazolonepropionase [Rhizobium rhizogenes]NSX94178.1 imidazolonepropionase [Agrobacterium tumefaciens]NTA40410.1 imidazolonepropionase [Agrobacterium salinitolerans]WHO11884.1 imidazolonepropionase [Agrobacterium cucumeris]ASK42059.1 imidazolonepropionase [Rhizobium rhizogenes]
MKDKYRATGIEMSVATPASDEEIVVWRNAHLATVAGDRDGLGVVEGGAIVVRGDRIAYVGTDANLPALARGAVQVDLEGRWVTPALIDCHTHLVFGGDRAHEFEMRLAGASCEEIALAGGGIASSVNATNKFSEDELVLQDLPRLDALMEERLSTVEIKSGYGLNVEAELKMLRVARGLETLRPVRVVTTYLAAHAIPSSYRGRNGDYIKDVVIPGLERGRREGLIDAVDGFCENIAFSPAEISKVFDKATAIGLPVKLHAEQLSDLGGAKLAASYRALSADHLECLDEEGAQALAMAGTVAVLLPGAFYTLREKQLPPVQALRNAGTPIAIATDCNPGTSPRTSLLLTMNMAATLFGLTVDECVAGATREAARALGLLHETGTLEVGRSADFAIWNIGRPAELV